MIMPPPDQNSASTVYCVPEVDQARSACQQATTSAPPRLTSSGRRDEFDMFALKVVGCPSNDRHDWAACPFAHSGEKAARRDLRRYMYTGIACSSMKQDGKCVSGDGCPYAHSAWEYWLHPTRYHTEICKLGVQCKRRICFFAHHADELRKPLVAPGLSPDCLKVSSLAAVAALGPLQPSSQQQEEQIQQKKQVYRVNLPGSYSMDANEHLHPASGGKFSGMASAPLGMADFQHGSSPLLPNAGLLSTSGPLNDQLDPLEGMSPSQRIQLATALGVQGVQAGNMQVGVALIPVSMDGGLLQQRPSADLDDYGRLMASLQQSQPPNNMLAARNALHSSSGIFSESKVRNTGTEALAIIQQILHRESCKLDLSNASLPKVPPAPYVAQPYNEQHPWAGTASYQAGAGAFEAGASPDCLEVSSPTLHVAFPDEHLGRRLLSWETGGGSFPATTPLLAPTTPMVSYNGQ